MADDNVREAIQEACDLLAEQKYGSPARSPGHNARLVLERALADLPPQRMREWRCFHCDEVFTDRFAAASHFGVSELETPGCKLNALEGGLLGIVRRQEEQLDQYRREDTASAREFYALGAEHYQALRREEEKGYAKGLADGRNASSL